MSGKKRLKGIEIIDKEELSALNKKQSNRNIKPKRLTKKEEQQLKDKKLWRKLWLIVLIGISTGVLFLWISSLLSGYDAKYSLSSLPEYGSASQDDLDGWVSVNAVSVEPIGEVVSHSQMNIGNNRKADVHTVHELYLITDSEGRTLVYESSYRKYQILNQITTSEKDPVSPGLLYGRLSSLPEKLSDCDGYGNIPAKYKSLPLLRKAASESVTIHYQTPAEKTFQSIFLFLGVINFLIGAGLFALMSKSGASD